MWRHYLQIWSPQLSLQHQNLWLWNRFVFWDPIQSSWFEGVSHRTIEEILLPRRNPIGQLFAHSISIPCVVFVNEFFCCLILLISKGWNLLLRFWETITNSQLFVVLSRFISLLSRQIRKDDEIEKIIALF